MAEATARACQQVAEQISGASETSSAQTYERWFATLAWIKDALDKAGELVAGQIGRDGRIQEALLRYWENAGKSSLRIDGRTIYLDRRITAAIRHEKHAEAMAELKSDANTAYLVCETVNANSLAAWVRALDRDNNDLPILPPDLTDLISVNEIMSIRSKKSK